MAKTTSIQIGIPEKQRKHIADGLSQLLADTYTLYLTTHNFHWNVTGPQFNTLHTMFMGQYTELWPSDYDHRPLAEAWFHPSSQNSSSKPRLQSGYHPPKSVRQTPTPAIQPMPEPA